MKPINIKIMGGLGNQLFQYAAGYGFSKDSGRPLQLDTAYYGIEKPHGDTSRQFMLGHYNIPAAPITPAATTIIPPQINTAKIKAKNGLKTAIKKIGFLYRLLKYFKDKRSVAPIEDRYVQPAYQFDDVFILNDDINLIIGQFNTEKYFKNYEQDIRDFYTLKEPLSDSGQHQLDKIKQATTPISLHVRRGDYVNNQAYQSIYGSVSLDYYKKAVDLLVKIYGDEAHFFLFSDDPAYVAETFSFLKNKTVVTGDTDFPHEDMFLMSQCDHHIIANSTFSWWGAWLNPSKDKTVIAPRWWVARETMKTQNVMDLYPEGWIIL